MGAINHPSYSNTGSTEQVVSNAIDASKAEDRVVELESSLGAEEMLFAECEGHDDNGTFWGEDCSGNKWTVRLV